MTLSELLESKFRGDIRFRGAAYIQAERVAVIRVTPDHLFAIVRDGVEYQTQLSRDNGILKLSCNCIGTDANKSGNPHCKHLWATILAADAGKYVGDGAKQGHIPPFAVEEEPLDFGGDDWDEDDEAAYMPMGSSRSQKRAERESIRAELDAAAAPRLREWESKLSELRKAMQGEDATSGSASAGRERQIFYEIDAVASEEAGLIVIQTSHRQRRSNGEWGKLKPLKLKPGKFEDIDDDEDRRILAHLVGGTPDRSSMTGPVTDSLAAHRYRLPHDLCQLLLPAICATGRIRILGDEERVTETLAWDEDGNWELCLKVEFEEAEQAWKLRGSLRRGDEHMSLKDPVLVVPGGLAITNTQVRPFQDFDAFPWVTLLRRSDDLKVPIGEEHELVDRLLDMPALPRLELPEELKLMEVVLEPKPILIVHAPGKSRWQNDRLKAEVLFDYDGLSIRASSSQWAIVQREASRCLVRDKPKEAFAWSQLVDYGFRRLLDQKRGAHDAEIAARDLAPAVRKLMAEGWQVRADGKQVRQAVDLKFQVKSGVDWFELHGDVNFDGARVTFPELLAALARGDGTIVLDDGSLGILPEEWLVKYGLLAGLGVADGEHLRFSAVQVSIVDALLASKENVDFDAKFLETRERLAAFDGIKTEREPATFQGELRPYQREGIGWLKFLEEFNFGGCLADDMGLGKTIQMLAFLEDRRLRVKKRNPTLIVVPKSLMFNWKHECERFTPAMRVMEYAGLDRAKMRDDFTKHDLILTTYGTLRRDILILKELSFDYIILDEAQAIKNSTSQVAKAVRLLQSRHRVGLSGTPIENHLGDLCSIFEFLNPGMLGRSSAFKQHAADPSNQETRRVLSDGLRPLILRRTKMSVASELPEKLEQTIFCEMGDDQQRLYNELRDHYRDSLLGLVAEQGMAKTRMHVLEALLRLRQAACHPALLNRSTPDDSSAKLDVLIPHLEELLEEKHKTLVFSQFTSMLSIVRQALDKKGIVYEYLDGQTRDRKERVERFQSDENCGVFLISLKAGGLGLNLTSADYVFILDPWWNPAVETQAIDRAHRVGQTRQVFAYRLICKNTVEEKIAELQKAKRELADAILEQNNSIMQSLTTDDLRLLLS
ncbi:SNF2-related protein [Schlesneria sp. T3-172]|uniref:SNF2-related protein n=1 Tax=Schlesneria TaxID=656899 RepID=UPI002F24F15C